MRRGRRSRLQFASLLLAAAAVAGTAGAAPRAPSGDLLLYTTDSAADGSREIHAISPTGHGHRRLTPHSPQGEGAAWSPQGDRIAFIASELEDLRYAPAPPHQWKRGDTVAVWMIDSNGRRAHRIRTLDDPELVRWSPDGGRLAVTSEGDLLVMRADGSKLVRISSRTVGVLDLAWSPDGRRLAVGEWRGNRLGGGISIVNASGGAFRRITRRSTRREIEDGSPLVAPSWAPDGRRLAYLRAGGLYGDDEYLLNLVVVSADGKHERRIARGQIYDARWSPDGRSIAVITPHGIDIVTSDGSRRRKLGDPPGEEFALSWSRDGKDILTACRTRTRTIAYFARADRRGFSRLTARRRFRTLYDDQQWAPTGTLVVARAGDEYKAPFSYLEVLRPDRRRLRLLRPALDSAPVWSPSGAQFAFERRVDRYSLVYTARADGSHQHFLGRGGWPRWSPDGRSIAFSRDAWVVVVQSNGKAPHRVAKAETAFWSPDSKTLAFAAEGSAWIVDRAGGAPRRLVGPDLPDHPPCARRISELTWSPDARRLAFLGSCGEDSGGAALYTVNADGTDITRIADASGYEDSLVWSPDGSRIAYADVGVFTLKPDGTELRRIANTGNGLTWSPDSKRLAFVRVAGRKGEGNITDHDVWVVNADGTNGRALTHSGDNIEPTWRPTRR